MKPFPLPHYIQFYPTVRCNQRCSFCFNDGSSKVRDLAPQEALNLLNILCDLGIRELDIMGGEPFLLPWMPSFLHEAIRENIMVNISTNGSFPDIIEKFRGVRPERISIGISLEGSSPETHNRLTCSHNFEKAVTSITTLVSLGLNPIVKTVVNRLNLHEIPSIIDLMKKLGVTRYYLIHMDLFSKARPARNIALGFVEFLKFYADIAARNAGIAINKVNASCFEKDTLPAGVRCAGGTRKLCIMPDGSAYPCNLFHHFPEFLLGNIFSDNFTNIWMSPKLDYFRYADKNHCRVTGCSNFVSCTGGCPAHGCFHNPDINGTDIRCIARS